MTLPLQGLLVVDATQDLAGMLCAKMLADAGASVTRVQIAGAHPVLPEPVVAWANFLDADKHRLDVDPESQSSTEQLESALADADVHLNSRLHHEVAPLGLDCESVCVRHPHVVTACVTPFGQSGKYARFRGDDAVISALCGLSDATPGFPDRCEREDDPPVQSRAPLAEVSGGLTAAIAVLGAVQARRANQASPRHIEISTLEAAVSMMVFEWGLTAYGGGVRGRRPGHADVEPNCYLPCRDGDVILPAFTEPHWRALVEMMGNPEWAAQEMFRSSEARTVHWKELRDHLAAWAKQRDGSEILEAAQARGLPCCPALDLADTIASDHIAATDAVQTLDTGVIVPRDPIVVDGRRRSPASASTAPAEPSPGAPRGGDTGVRPTGAPEPLTPPLAGIRVLDLSQYVAGPFAGQLLASLGAEVVLVESGMRLVTRSIPPFAGEPAYDASMNFNYVNRGKKSVLVNLRSADGRRALERLIASSDVVIENFSRRAVERLGLTYDSLSAIREDIVVGSISGFGRTGPWGGYVALHSGVILMSGLASVTRDANGRPRLVGSIYPDLMTGAYLTLGIQQALINRDRSGKGCHVEVSMLDVVLNSVGGLVPAAAAGGSFEPHTATFLRTNEPARFVVVSDAVVADMREEVSRLSRDDAMELLQSQGVPAAAVLDMSEVMVDPHLAARSFVVPDDHPVATNRPVPASPWQYDGLRPRLRHAPLLGDSTDEVLRDVAGIGRSELETLHAAGALA